MKQARDNAILDLASLGLAQLDQPVRVPSVAHLASETELDALLRPDAPQALLEVVDALRAKALGETVQKRDAVLR